MRQQIKAEPELLAAPARSVPPIVHNVLQATGQPLEASTRTFMEQRFGHDFSRVRIHTGERLARQTQLMRAPDPTATARYPTADERSAVTTELSPQQQAARQSGNAQVDPVTDPAQFRTDMKTCMGDYVGKLLPIAQSRESSSVSLDLPEVQSMADIAQREVNRFYKTYLQAAVYSADEKKRMATFKLRDRIHMVSSKHSQADEIACNWLSSRMADACGKKLGDFNVLASVDKAKASCDPSRTGTATTSTTAAPANERDQVLFESVRDDIQNTKRADLQTIVKYQASFQGSGESFIQDKLKPESGDTGSMTLRRGRWDAFGTIIHEMLHAVAHEKFRQAIAGVENQGVAVEGFAEYFTRTVYNDVKRRAEKDNSLRAGIEGVNEPFDDSLIPERTGTTYDKYVDGVERIKTGIAGNEDSLRVAYFMGRVEYIGLGGWNEKDAERHEALRHPANSFGFAALLTGDTRGLLTVDYTRIVVGRGKPFQFGLGADLYFLSPGEHKEADLTVPEASRFGVGGRAMLQYSWPNFYIRGTTGVGASVSTDKPFEESVRLDLIPGAELGVRIGWARIGAGTQVLIPIVGGPPGEKAVKAGAMLGVSAEY